MHEGLLVHRKIRLLLSLNVMMEEILNEHKDAPALPTEAAATFRATALSMGRVLSQVAEHYAYEGWQLFDMTSKLHFIMHIADLSSHINPRRTWCFLGEDFMQKMQRLGKSCMKGNTTARATCKLAQRHRTGLHYLLTSDDT